MVILLLAKIVKLGWFDEGLYIKDQIVHEITHILQNMQDEQQKVVGLECMHQIIVEMTY